MFFSVWSYEYMGFVTINDNKRHWKFYNLLSLSSTTFCGSVTPYMYILDCKVRHIYKFADSLLSQRITQNLCKKLPQRPADLTQIHLVTCQCPCNYTHNVDMNTSRAIDTMQQQYSIPAPEMHTHTSDHVCNSNMPMNTRPSDYRTHHATIIGYRN